MPSVHNWKAIGLAADKGGFASVEKALPLWDLSKRELVEIAIRLGCLVADDTENPESGVNTVLQERQSLKDSGII